MRVWCAFLLFLAAGPAAAERLTPAEIQAELVGAAIAWWEEGGWHHGSLFLAPDGSARIDLAGPERADDTGRWWQEGDRICTVWSNLRAGAQTCYSLERAEAGRFMTSGGNVFELRDAGA